MESHWTLTQPAWSGGAGTDAAGWTLWQADSGPLRVDFPGADWRAWRSFRIQLAPARQTHARLRLEILGPADAVLGHIVFAVDWQGEAALSFWLDRLEPRAGAERWRDARAIRLVCQQPGAWPTEVRAGGVAASAGPVTFQVNESDTIIEAGWQSLMNRPEEWQVAPERSTVPAAEARIRGADPMWMINREAPSPEAAAEIYREEPNPWMSFEFPQRASPGRLCIERRFGLDLDGYRDILAKATWDKDIALTVTAIVDGGREVALLDGEAPRGDFYTFGAALDGARRLDAVRITLQESASRAYGTTRPVGAGLFWILLRRPSALDDAPADAAFRAQLDGPDSSTPIGDPLAGALPIGFYLRRDELPALRERARAGAGKAIFDPLLAEADAALASEVVERGAYNSAYLGGVGFLKGFRGAGMRTYAPPVALAHLITGDPKYAAACRRWILRAARSDLWMGEGVGTVDRPRIGEITHYDDSFTGWHPRGFAGYMDHPFFVAFIGEAVALAYDMLYHCFSPAEREEVEQGMARHGLYILYDKLSQSRAFYVKMNQGALFGLPLLMQTAFLKRRDPTYAHMHAFALQFLQDFGTGPWDEEGVCGEGPGYGLGTAYHFCLILPALAACLGRPVADVVPPSFRNVMDYVRHVRSTWQPKGRLQFLGWSDGSNDNWVSGEVLAFFARYLGDPAARFFWDEQYAADPPRSPYALLWLPDGVRGEAPRLPPARVFRNQPLAFLRTGWRTGDTLLALSNIRQVLGHGHRDRASLILEFNGEQLLLDPGMIAYGDPTANQYKQSAVHNTLTFSQRSQIGGIAVFDTAIRGFLTTSGDACPGLAGGIDWVIADAGAVYPEARVFHRHVIFLRPGLAFLFDEVEARQAESMELNFTCLGRLTLQGEACLSVTERSRLLIHTQADRALKAETGGWGTHWPDIPSYRLARATAEPALCCRFLTALAPYRAGEPEPEVGRLTLAGSLGFRVRAGDDEALAVFRVAPDGQMPSGVRTDARAVVARWSAGRLTGAAVWGGAWLDVEGVGRVLTVEPPASPEGLAGMTTAG